MNDPLTQLIGAVVNFCCYRDMYRTDPEQTAIILKKLRQRLYRAEWDLYPKLECISDIPETFDQPEAAE